MLNCNNYESVFGNLFMYGFGFSLGGVSLVKFTNGAKRIDINGPTLASPSTGHWPFSVFSFKAVTGELSAWQLTVLGLTIGRKKFPSINADGTVAGPDYRKTYWLFSCLNHQDKILEEII
jgi:hypothetical protein